MLVFPNNELTYYRFGVRVGVRNLAANGWQLGLKKTVGKITQPINAPSRFPGYDHFVTAIGAYMAASPPGRRVKILDVGSPKLLGLYLSHTMAADVTPTDISDLKCR